MSEETQKRKVFLSLSTKNKNETNKFVMPAEIQVNITKLKKK